MESSSFQFLTEDSHKVQTFFYFKLLRFPTKMMKKTMCLQIEIWIEKSLETRRILLYLTVIFPFQINIEWAIVRRKPEAIEILLLGRLSFTDTHSNDFLLHMLFFWQLGVFWTIFACCVRAKSSSSFSLWKQFRKILQNFWTFRNHH